MTEKVSTPTKYDLKRVEITWHDASYISGEVNLDALKDKGLMLTIIGYLVSINGEMIQNDFVTLIQEHYTDGSPGFRHRQDLPLHNVISIKELKTGGKIYERDTNKEKANEEKI